VVLQNFFRFGSSSVPAKSLGLQSGLAEHPSSPRIASSHGKLLSDPRIASISAELLSVRRIASSFVELLSDPRTARSSVELRVGSANPKQRFCGTCFLVKVYK
jgi:hypothetical protein